MRRFPNIPSAYLRPISYALAAIVIATSCSAAEPSEDMQRMGGESYPKAFIWWTTANRIVENTASEAEADRVLSQLGGVASPCLHLDYFAGFKRRHPEQFVFLFCQGHDFSEKPTVFDPVDRSTFYPGHWVHCAPATITADVSASPRPGWPEAIPRHMTIRPTEGEFDALDSYVGTDPFTATFYFRDMPTDQVTLQLQIEGEEAVTLHAAEAYAHADAGYRVFEHGLVLANPSNRPYAFNLGAIAPQAHYLRLTGSSQQDPATNNGQAVGATVTLGPRDGLFLIQKTERQSP